MVLYLNHIRIMLTISSFPSLCCPNMKSAMAKMPSEQHTAAYPNIIIKHLLIPYNGNVGYPGHSSIIKKKCVHNSNEKGALYEHQKHIMPAQKHKE